MSPSSPGEPLGPAGPGSPTGPCTPSRPAGPWGPFSPWFWRKGSDPHYHRRLMKILVQGVTLPIQNLKKPKQQTNRKESIKGTKCIGKLY